jgi:hypothetical protein
MKCKDFQVIDGIEIVTSVRSCNIDPEATKRNIAEDLGISINDILLLPNFEEILYQHAAMINPGPNSKTTSDEAGTLTQEKLANLEAHQILTTDDEIIPDWRGTKYYLKSNGTWNEEAITAIGVPLPEDAVLPDNLTAEQSIEISAQKEALRIAALDADQKVTELQNALNALADEADRLSRRAQIQGITFDAVTWYQEHKAPIEAKYAA